MEFDHALYAVQDFEAAARRWWDQFGLTALPGDKQVGWGTGDWIVPLGLNYIELIGVVDEDKAAENPMGRHLLSVLNEGERFIGWCVRPKRFKETLARLRLDYTGGSRVTSTKWGDLTARWRSSDPMLAMTDPSRPFFIEWLDGANMHPGQMKERANHPVRIRQHPPLSQTERQILDLLGRGKTSAEVGDELGITGRAVDAHLGQLVIAEAPDPPPPPGIVWVEVRGDEPALRSWLADDSLPVRVAPGPSALLAVGVETAGREIVVS